MEKDQLYYDEMVTPLGKMCIIADESAIVRIDFGTFEQIKEKAGNWLSRYFGKPAFIRGCQIINEAIQELEEYFSNKRNQFTISYKLHGTSFQQAVWNATRQFVPYGETKSYKQIGEIIENPKAVRAIGGALNKNPCSIIIPCHRVIGASGKMVGYGGGLDKKTFLLQFEKH